MIYLWCHQVQYVSLEFLCPFIPFRYYRLKLINVVQVPLTAVVFKVGGSRGR